MYVTKGLRLSKSRISTDSLYNLYIEDLEMYVTKGLRLSKSRISTDSLYNLYLDFRHAEKKGGRSPNTYVHVTCGNPSSRQFRITSLLALALIMTLTLVVSVKHSKSRGSTGVGVTQ